MKWDLIIHGVSAGQKYWAPEASDDLEYIRTFYNHQEHNCFEIDLHRCVNDVYSVYSLLINRNVIGGDNRPGSYLGVTLRIKGEYCSNADLLYAVLLSGVRRFLYGKLVQPTADDLKYLVTDFNSCEQSFRQFESYLVSCFTNNFAQADFGRLQGFPQSSNSVVSISWADYADSIIAGLLKSGKKIVLANNVVTKREQTIIAEKESACQQKLRDIETSCNSRIKEVESKYNSLSSTNRQLQMQVDTLTREKKEISKEKESLSAILSEIKKKGNSEKLASVVTKLEEICVKLTGESLDKKSQILSMIKKWFTVILLLVIFGIASYSLYSTNIVKENVDTTAIEKKDLEIRSLRGQLAQAQQDLKKAIEQKDRIQEKLAVFQEQTDDSTQSSTTTQTNSDFSKAKIDIKGYNGKDSLKIGQEFECEVVGCPTDAVEWKADGFKVDNKKSLKTKITVIDNNKGKAVLSVYYNDNKINTREFNIIKK